MAIGCVYEEIAFSKHFAYRINIIFTHIGEKLFNQHAYAFVFPYSPFLVPSFLYVLSVQIFLFRICT